MLKKLTGYISSLRDRSLLKTVLGISLIAVLAGISNPAQATGTVTAATGANNPAAKTIYKVFQNTVMLQMTVNSSLTDTLSQIMITPTFSGTGSSTDYSLMFYNDADGDGIVSSGDTQLMAYTAITVTSGSQQTFTLSSPLSMTAATTYNIIVLARTNSALPANTDTLQATVTNIGTTGNASLSNTVVGNTVTLTGTSPSITFTDGTGQPAAARILNNAPNLAVQEWNITAAATADTVLTVAITPTGTINENTGITSVQFYIDNGNNTFSSSSDKLLISSPATFTANDTKTTFTITGGIKVPTSGSVKVWVVYNLAGNATDGQTIIQNISATSDVAMSSGITVAGVAEGPSNAQTVDVTAPTLPASAIAANNSVQPNTVTLTFSENLATSTVTTAGNWTVTNNAGTISYGIASASLVNNVVTLTLNTVDQTNATTFITNAAIDAHIKVTPSTNITDVVGHAYAAGLVTESGATPTKDSTAPTLAPSAIVVNNQAQPNTIILTFNEKLATTTADTLGNWAAANNGGTITYGLASASLASDGVTVTLTLNTLNPATNTTFITNAAAAAGIKVTPSASVTDVAGIAFAAGQRTASGATNVLDATAPTLTTNISVNNNVQPNTITLVADEKLDKTTAETANKWVIKSNDLGVTFGIASASLASDGVTVTLTMNTVNPASTSTFVTNAQIAAHIKAVFSSSTITDVAGTAFADGTVTESTGISTEDATPPTLPANAIVADNSAQPNTITLTFSEKLDKTSAETAGNWTVTNNGASVSYGIASASLSNNIVTLTLNTVNPANPTTYMTNAAITGHLKVTPSASVKDVSGVAYATGLVTESGATPTEDSSAPTLAGAGITVNNSVQPNTVTLTFSEKLDQTTAQTATNWTVTNNAGTITYHVASASLTNAVVTLTLATVNQADATTYINNSAVDAHIKVTPSTSVTDVAGVAYGGSIITEDGVRTKDSTAPALTSAAAIVVNNSVQPNTVTLTFSEKLATTTATTVGNWAVKNQAGTITYGLASAALASDGVTVTLTLNAVNPAVNTTFITNAAVDAHVKVTPSASITDVAGITYAAGEISESGAVPTKDAAPPTLAASAIVVDNTVDPNTITLTFSEKLDQTQAQTAGNWTVTNNGGTITYGVAAASLANNVVTLSLAAVSISDATTYITNTAANAHLKVTPNVAITDVAGVAYAGGLVTESGATHTEHSSVPTYSVAGTSLNAAGDTVALTFNEPMDTTTITNAILRANTNVRLYYSDNAGTTNQHGITVTTSSVAWNGGKTVATITLDEETDLAYIPNGKYIGVTLATSTVTDLYGVAAASTQVYTGAGVSKESTKPTISSVVGNSNSSGNDTVVITSNEVLASSATTVTNWTVQYDDNGSGLNIQVVPLSNASAALDATHKILTITLDKNIDNAYLPSSKYVKATPNATNVTDLVGNGSISAVYSVSGVTAESTAPTVSTSSPALHATGVALNTTIVATMSEALKQSTVNNNTVKLYVDVNNNNAVDIGTDTEVPSTVTLQNSGASTTISIHPLSNLTASGDYIYRISSGVQDLSGNALAANADYDFTSATDTSTLAVTNVSTVANPNGTTGYATSNGTYADGWAWTFNITASSTQTGLAMKFSDFVSGANSIAVATSSSAGIIRYCSSQAATYDCTDNSEGSSTWKVITLANTYPANITLNADSDSSTAGRQVTIKVQMKVPGGTPAGSYSATYGVRTQ